MLARRFTIVCLLTLVFALAFAHLVTATKSNPRWANGAIYRCGPVPISGCAGFQG
jgi:hypothetical protein